MAEKQSVFVKIELIKDEGMSIETNLPKQAVVSLLANAIDSVSSDLVERPDEEQPKQEQ